MELSTFAINVKMGIIGMEKYVVNALLTARIARTSSIKT